MSSNLMNNTQLAIYENALKNNLDQELEKYLIYDSDKLIYSGKHLDLIYRFGIKYKLLSQDDLDKILKLNSKNKPLFSADYVKMLFRLLLIDCNIDPYLALDDKFRSLHATEDLYTKHNELSEGLIKKYLPINSPFFADYLMLTQCPYFNESAIKYVSQNVPNLLRGNNLDNHINYFDALDLRISCEMPIEYFEFSLIKDSKNKPIFSPLQVQQIYLSGHFKVDLNVIANPKNSFAVMSQINQEAEKKLEYEIHSGFLNWFGLEWLNKKEDVPWMISVLRREI